MDKLKDKPMDIHRYNQADELMGMEDVSGWADDEIGRLIVAIKSRGDGSYAVLKERSAL